MSETCSTCKHFGKREAGGVLVQNEIGGWTSSMTMHNFCNGIKDASDYSGDYPGAAAALAILEDDEPNIMVRLRVLPTFGCVLHEPR